MPTLPEYLAEHPDVAPKPRHRHPEWTLQTKILGFVREFVACEHEFCAHDRSFDATGKQHLFEAERGIRRGWMDTELAIEGGITFRCELKWGANKPDAEQDRLIARMNVLGHPTQWTNSVAGYYALSAMAGVRWRAGALARASYLDEWLRATFAKPVVMKKRASSKPRKEPAGQKALRVGAAFNRP